MGRICAPLLMPVIAPNQCPPTINKYLYIISAATTLICLLMIFLYHLKIIHPGKPSIINAWVIHSIIHVLKRFRLIVEVGLHTFRKN